MSCKLLCLPVLCVVLLLCGCSRVEQNEETAPGSAIVVDVLHSNESGEVGDNQCDGCLRIDGKRYTWLAFTEYLDARVAAAPEMQVKLDSGWTMCNIPVKIRAEPNTPVKLVKFALEYLMDKQLWNFSYSITGEGKGRELHVPLPKDIGLDGSDPDIFFIWIICIQSKAKPLWKVNDQKAGTREELDAELKRLISSITEGDCEFRVSVDSHADIEYRYFYTALEVLLENGLDNIIVSPPRLPSAQWPKPHTAFMEEFLSR